MRVQIDRATGRIHLHIPGLAPSAPQRGENQFASPPAGGIEGGRSASNQNHGRDLNSWPGHAALDEATAVAEAETVIDPTLLALRDLLDEQTRAADAIAQAAEMVSQAQQATSFRQAQRAVPEPVEGITVPASIAAKIRNLLAREPLFLDYETTHLHLKHGARVCEVSVLNGQGRAVYSTLVNPQQPIPPAATQVHGLTDADVAAAPTWVEIAPALRQVLANRLVVAFGVGFERKFTPKWGIEWTCAKKLADQALGAWPGHGGLQARLKWCGLTGGPAHTAAGDNLSTIRLLRFLAGLEQIN